MKRIFLLLALVMFVLTLRAPAQTSPAGADQQRMVGTWKLVSYLREETPSGAKSDVMGAHPSGYINYTADGRLILIIVGSGRKRPAGPVATPEEAKALLTSMLAYAGTYTVDTRAKTISHNIEVSWDETRTGESHLRTYKFEGDRLILTTVPSRDPATGKDTVRTVTWERVK
ncbi:MAG TPA: lipocalin-like domain-containing protein [Candidatus Sulfotelmatobacter sp.]|nr:lipocalin-like domain-containing protein [Candidatus Sulfotelmatobacter sp.]